LCTIRLEHGACCTLKLFGALLRLISVMGNVLQFTGVLFWLRFFRIGVFNYIVVSYFMLISSLRSKFVLTLIRSTTAAWWKLGLHQITSQQQQEWKKTTVQLTETTDSTRNTLWHCKSSASQKCLFWQYKSFHGTACMAFFGRKNELLRLHAYMYTVGRGTQKQHDGIFSNFAVCLLDR